MSFELKGDRELTRKLRKLAAGSPDYAKGALRTEAEYTMTRCKRDRVPEDLGTLRASGHVLPAERKGRDIEVTMGFGGPAGAGNLGESNKEDVGYALKQHEGVHFAHKVGEAKYLERQINEDLPGMAGRIAEEIGKRIDEDAR